MKDLTDHDLCFRGFFNCLHKRQSYCFVILILPISFIPHFFPPLFFSHVFVPCIPLKWVYFNHSVLIFFLLILELNNAVPNSTIPTPKERPTPSTGSASTIDVTQTSAAGRVTITFFVIVNLVIVLVFIM